MLGGYDINVKYSFYDIDIFASSCLRISGMVFRVLLLTRNTSRLHLTDKDSSEQKKASELISEARYQMTDTMYL